MNRAGTVTTVREKKVIVTMPAYEAAMTLEKTLNDLPPGVAGEIIVVDDFSSDNTSEVATSLGLTVIRHPENRGYGGNQKTCYKAALEAGADIVVMLHPDYQYDPKAVPLLIGPLLSGDADMTFGSRFAGMSDPREGGMPLYRYVGNRITTKFQNVVMGTRFTELHSGMRAYTRDCLLAMPFLKYNDDFSFDAQFITEAIGRGQRIIEVPIPTRYTLESSSIAVGPSLRYVWASARLALKSRAKWGRRGRSSKLVPAEAHHHSGVAASAGPCIRCDSRSHVLVYEANANGPVDPTEYRCTTSGLNVHDDIIQCQVCGLLSANGGPTTEEILRGYEAVEDASYLDETEVRRGVFEWMLVQLDPYVASGRRLLEFGSHVGMFLSVADSRGWHASGVEPSHWAVAWGVENLAVDLTQGTIEEFEAEEPFDVVAMFDVLEHVVNPRLALDKANQALHENGLLLLSTVNTESIHGRIRGGRWPWFIRSHLHYFTPETLTGLLRDTGFEPLEWRVVPRPLHLSYVLDRAETHLGVFGRLARIASRTWDPQLPMGLLGDICLVVARKNP